MVLTTLKLISLRPQIISLLVVVVVAAFAHSPVHSQGLISKPHPGMGGSQWPSSSALPGAPGASPSSIWNQTGNRVGVGTLLNGILEDDLSSGKNHAGDVFSIRLEDGFFKNGLEVIPRHSKIVGAVMHTVPGGMQTHGNPGNLQVSLQTLVFPDGRNTPISGFLVHNSNMDMMGDPRKNSAAFAASYYPKQVVHSLGSIGRTLSGRAIGIKPGYTQRGSDFKLSQGEALAVRLNRSLDLTHMAPPPTNFAPTGMTIPNTSLPVVPGVPYIPNGNALGNSVGNPYANPFGAAGAVGTGTVAPVSAPPFNSGQQPNFLPPAQPSLLPGSPPGFSGQTFSPPSGTGSGATTQEPF